MRLPMTNDRINKFDEPNELKYVGVQSWKAMHLPTLDIRVKQMGNRTMKWEINFGFLFKMS